VSEKRKWTLEELRSLPVEAGYTKDQTFDKKVVRWVAIRKESSDGLGSFLVRLFKKVDDHFEEVDVKKEAQKMAKKLAKSVSATTMIREVLIEMAGERFTDLMERMEKKGKVTLGIRKGSCVFLYVAGKQGRKQTVQLTS